MISKEVKSRRAVLRFLKLLKKRFKELPKTAEGAGFQSRTSKSTKRAFVRKAAVLRFFLKNSRWPNRNSKLAREKAYGCSYSNYCSKESAGYDGLFRRLALATGRTTNGKSKHNVKENKLKVLAFIESEGRVPATWNVKSAPKEEKLLRRYLEHYAQTDMAFKGKVFSLDKCHLSGIPRRFRPLINRSLDLDQPLVRLPQKILKAGGT